MKAASTPLSFNLPLFTSPSPFCDSSNDNAIFVCQVLPYAWLSSLLIKS